MNRQYTIIQIGTICLVLLSALTNRPAESLSVLLQKGIFAEETEGNLDAAIKIYEGIVKDNDANRSLVAQAQYRLGVCELKRGKKEEATAQFRKLIEQFPKETEILTKTRQRLKELGQSVSSIVVRQLATGIGDWDINRMSPDGKMFSYVDWDTGDLWLRELRTGSIRKLTQSRGWTNGAEHAINAAFSPDGKRIAYDWFNESNDCYEVRVSALDGSSLQVIAAIAHRFLFVGDWSPDGKSIAVEDWSRESRKAKVWDRALSLISVGDGKIRKLNTSEATNITSIRFSPDGHYLAYNAEMNRRGASGGRVTNDIFILNLETNSRERAVEYVANEKLIGWHPKESVILFTSERGGGLGLWSIAVENGHAQGKPKLIKSDLGYINPLGLSRDGALIYASEVPPVKEFSVAKVDFKAGRVVSPPKQIRTPELGLADKVIHSGNCRFLYFRSIYTGARQKSFNMGANPAFTEPAAYVLDLETGEQRMVPSSPAWVHRIGWWWPTADYSSLLVSLFGGENEGGLYSVDAQSGVIKPIALHSRNVEQSPDNPIRFHVQPEFVAYGRRYANPKRFVLVKHDLRLKQEAEYEIPGLSQEFMPHLAGTYRNRAALLSDGKTFFFNKKVADDQYILMRHDLATGTQKEFLKGKSPIGLIDTDAHHLLIVTKDNHDRLVFTHYVFENGELHEREHVTLPDGYAFRGQHFGGPFLLLIKNPKDQDSDALTDLWELSMSTGDLKNTGLAIPINHYSGMKNDEQTVLFHTTSIPGSREIWSIDNLLLPVASAE